MEFADLLCMTLLVFDLLEWVLEYWALNEWCIRVQINLKNFKFFLFGLYDAKEIVCISQECITNNCDVVRQLISLNECLVEGVEDEYEIVFGRHGEVRPIEAVRMVHLFFA